MTDQTNALATRNEPYNRFKALIKTDNVQERFQAILDKRSTEFLASLLSLVSADAKLLECSPTSIFTAAAKAAILRLPISKELGFAYIVPFKREATFVIGYKGLIQLAIRSSQYETINATEVYQGEELTVDRLTGMVKLNGKRSGDQVTGYVSYFKLKNGFEKYLYFDRGSMERHAAKYSKSWGNANSAWSTNFDGMGKKTVLRLLLSKYGLLSIEMQDDDTPIVTEDERIVPRFEDLGNPLEGEAHDVTAPELPAEAQPEAAPEAPAPAQPEPPVEPASIDPAAILVEAGYAENIHEAKKICGYLKLSTTMTAEAVKTLGALYRGWRDETGCTPEQAAQKALEGKQP